MESDKSKIFEKVESERHPNILKYVPFAISVAIVVYWSKSSTDRLKVSSTFSAKLSAHVLNFEPKSKPAECGYLDSPASIKVRVKLEIRFSASHVILGVSMGVNVKRT